jgi:hypothetical protein
VLGLGRCLDERTPQAEGAFEGDAGGIDEFDEDQLGGPLLAGVAALGLEVWAVDEDATWSCWHRERGSPGREPRLRGAAIGREGDPLARQPLELIVAARCDCMSVEKRV